MARKPNKDGERGPFIDARGYAQKHPNRSDHLWGFDDESIFYDPSPEVALPLGDKSILIQEHPELMHRILNLCQEFAKELAAKEASESESAKESE